MNKSVIIDTDELGQVLVDARFISGFLSIMEAALSTNDGRIVINDNIEFVLMDVAEKMDRTMTFLEKHS